MTYRLSHPRRSLPMTSLWVSRLALAALLCSLLGAMQAVPIASAARMTYYVATTGSDLSPCTLTAPCASLLRATSLTLPGDTVIVQPGTYGPQTIVALGIAGLPITVMAQPGVTLTRQFPASDAVQSTPLLQIDGSAYVVVSGFNVIGMKDRSDYVEADQPYSAEVVVQTPGGLNGSETGIVISNTTIMHANQTCLKTEDEESGDSFINNTLVDCGQPGNTLDHGIYISGPNTLVKGNTVTGASGYGIHFYGTVDNGRIIANTVTQATLAGIIATGPGTIINGNTVYSNSWGITANPFMTVTNNVFMLNQTAGLGITNIGNVVIANNTFYHDNGTEIYETTGSPTGPITVENNIFVPTPRPSNPFSAIGTIPPGSLVDYNLYDGAAIPQIGTLVADGGHSLWSPAFFVNETATPLPDLHLNPLSPAIGAGVGVGLHYGGTAPDMGALCFSCGKPTPVSHGPGPQTFYVAAGAAVAGAPCSTSAPCASLLAASRLAQPGDTIVVASGTYTLPQIIEARGTAAAPITIQASRPVTFSRPVSPTVGLAALLNDHIQQQPLLTVSDSQYTSIGGFILSGMKGRLDGAPGGPMYSGDLTIQSPARLGTAVTITSTVVQNSLASCISADGESLTIANSQAVNCGSSPGQFGINVASNGITVTGNIITATADTGLNAVEPAQSGTTSDVIVSNTISLAGQANPCCDGGSGIQIAGTQAWISGNRVSHNVGAGILINGHNHWVDGNVLIGNASSNNELGGIVIQNGSAISVTNNTFYQDAGLAELAVGYAGIASSTVISNNIFYGTSPLLEKGIGVSSMASDTSADYNMFYQTTTPISGTTGAGNVVWGLHSQTGIDPQFIAPGTNFHLQSVSRAIGAGVYIGLPYAGHAPDLGAFCFNCPTGSSQ